MTVANDAPAVSAPVTAGERVAVLDGIRGEGYDVIGQFEYLEGTAEVQGTKLVLKPKKGKFKSQDTCVERYNYEKDADLSREEYGWEIGLDDYDQEVLRMTWPDGEISEYWRED